MFRAAKRLATVTAAAVIVLTSCKPAEISMAETPIKIVQERVGRGRPAAKGDIVCLDYQIELPAGEIILKDDDFCFQLGAEPPVVIAGVDEATMGMRVGGHRVVSCPPHKHWGRAGYGDGIVPPKTMLTLRLTVRAIR